jgi:ectoine hydroxylase-related dioxygenase (phytanoyl-CoA dioxygenase family)
MAQLVAEQLFLLDTRGWVVVEDALSPAQVEALLAELQRATLLDTEGSLGKPTELMRHQSEMEHGTVRRWPFPYHFGEAFTGLIDNPAITPLLHGRLGADIKLDHEYVQTLKPHPAGVPIARGGIHGGPNHRLQSSGKGEMLTVVYELLDVSPQDGGFGAVTGSHHTRYDLPISRKVDCNLTYPDIVTRVSAKAGSAIVFTEYMMHTTYPWTGKGQRKSIFYKYSARDRSVPILAVHGSGRGISIDRQPGRDPRLLRDPEARAPQTDTTTARM